MTEPRNISALSSLAQILSNTNAYLDLQNDTLLTSTTKPAVKPEALYTKIKTLFDQVQPLSEDNVETLKSWQGSLATIKTSLTTRQESYQTRIAKIWSCRGMRQFCFSWINYWIHRGYHYCAFRTDRLAKKVIDFVFPDFVTINLGRVRTYQTTIQTLDILNGAITRKLQSIAETERRRVQEQQRLEREKEERISKNSNFLRNNSKELGNLWNCIDPKSCRQAKKTWTSILQNVQDLMNDGLSLDQIKTTFFSDTFTHAIIPDDAEKRAKLLKCLKGELTGVADCFSDGSITLRAVRFCGELVKTEMLYQYQTLSGSLCFENLSNKREDGRNSPRHFDLAVDHLDINAIQTQLEKKKSLLPKPKANATPIALKTYVTIDLKGNPLPEDYLKSLIILSLNPDISQMKFANVGQEFSKPVLDEETAKNIKITYSNCIHLIANENKLKTHPGTIRLSCNQLGDHFHQFLDKRKDNPPAAIALIIPEGKLSKIACAELVKLAKRDDVVQILIDCETAPFQLPEIKNDDLRYDFYFSLLPKIQFKGPLALDFSVCCLKNESEKQAVWNNIETFLESSPEYDTFNLSGCPFLTNKQIDDWREKGLLKHIWTLNLQDCPLLTTDLLSVLMMLPALHSVRLPDTIPLGKSLPSSDNPLVIRKLYSQSKNLIAKAALQYTGPHEYATLILIDLVQRGCAKEAQDFINANYRTLTSLDPESVFYWLSTDFSKMLPNNRVVEIRADFVGAINNHNLASFLQKFPLAQSVSLQGCQNITDGAFEDPSFLKSIAYLDLTGTKVTEKCVMQILLHFPHIQIQGYSLKPKTTEQYPWMIDKEKPQNTPITIREVMEVDKQDDVFYFHDDGNVYQSVAENPNCTGTCFVMTADGTVLEYQRNITYIDEPLLRDLYEITPQNILKSYEEAVAKGNRAKIRICRTYLELFGEALVQAPIMDEGNNNNNQTNLISQQQLKAILKTPFSPIAPELADFTFCLGDQRFPIHKHLWMNQTPWFRRVFSFGEDCFGRNEQVFAPDPQLTPRLFQYIINYMYHGSIGEPFTVELAVNLSWIAHLFEMQDLKDKCDAELFTAVSKLGCNAQDLPALVAIYILEVGFGGKDSERIINHCKLMFAQTQNILGHKVVTDLSIEQALFNKHGQMSVQPAWATLIAFARDYLNN